MSKKAKAINTAAIRTAAIAKLPKKQKNNRIKQQNTAKASVDFNGSFLYISKTKKGGINTYAKHVCWRRRDGGLTHMRSVCVGVAETGD